MLLLHDEYVIFFHTHAQTCTLLAWKLTLFFIIQDRETMNAIREFLECLLGTLQVVVAVAMTVPLLLLPLLPVIAYIVWCTYAYIQASRELKRMESINKSPGAVLHTCVCVCAYAMY